VTDKLRTGRVVLYLALFSSSFALTALALRPVLPAGDTRTARAEIKLEHLRSELGEVDTLFLGSSRAFRGFQPRLFDRLTSEGGHPTRSFNLGVPGSRAMELLRMLERVEELGPSRLRWVFIDPEGFEVLLEERNYLSRAVVDWHDLGTTKLVVDYIRRTRGEGPGADRKVRMHATACAYNLINVGRALRWTDTLLGVEPSAEEVLASIGPEGDGYVPQDPTGARSNAKGFRTKRAEYEERVEDLRTSRARTGPPAPEAIDLFQRLEQRIEAMGATAIFVTQPGLYLQHDLIAAAEDGTLRRLLRYDDPDVVQELYEVEVRWDSNHLNPEGARRFTQRLASDFLPLAAEEAGG
jgi:hypothetical protein